jgi:hypothetical protein
LLVGFDLYLLLEPFDVGLHRLLFLSFNIVWFSIAAAVDRRCRKRRFHIRYTTANLISRLILSVTLTF